MFEQTRPTNERALARRVLACIAEDEASAHVLRWARELGRAHGAEVALLHVTTPLSPAPAVPAIGWIGIGVGATPSLGDPAADRARANTLLARAKSGIEGDVARVTTLRREGDAADEILRAAREIDADTIVLGAVHHGLLERLMLGDVARGVVGHTRRTVVLAGSV